MMGSTVYGQQNIQNETVAYFHNLYKLDNPRLRAKLMGVILVTDEENDRFISMPEESDIKNFIFSMPNSKTPGPDGFSASSFNIFWAGLMWYMLYRTDLPLGPYLEVSIIPYLHCPYSKR
jgi:hypothetical protein